MYRRVPYNRYQIDIGSSNNLWAKFDRWSWSGNLTPPPPLTVICTRTKFRIKMSDSWPAPNDPPEQIFGGNSLSLISEVVKVQRRHSYKLSPVEDQRRLPDSVWCLFLQTRNDSEITARVKRHECPRCCVIFGVFPWSVVLDSVRISPANYWQPVTWLFLLWIWGDFWSC